MSKSIHFTTEGLPFPPSVNAYLGHRVVKRGRANIVMAYTKQSAKVFQKKFGEYLDKLIEETGWDKEQTRGVHYYLDYTVYFPRRGSDEQNILKVSSDVLNGKLIIDDQHLVTRAQAVYYDSNNPRVEYYLHPVEYTGIFPNDKSLGRFEDKCSTCTRFLDGRCSILKDSKIGKMRDEITYEESNNEGHITHENISCTKYKEKK